MSASSSERVGRGVLDGCNVLVRIGDGVIDTVGVKVGVGATGSIVSTDDACVATDGEAGVAAHATSKRESKDAKTILIKVFSCLYTSRRTN
jgi:hypothetical protein